MSSIILKRRKKNSFLISDNLKELRKNQDLTLEELSKKILIPIGSLKQYELDTCSPSLAFLEILSKFYGVSIDFLVLWNATCYVRNIELIRLAETIDKLDQVKRFQVESTAMTLIGNKASEVSVKEDSIELLNDIHSNLKQLREIKQVSQKDLAKALGISQGLVAGYENKTIPPLDNMIKLSEFFGVSIHSLITSNKLTFQIENKGLKNSILKADQLLSVKDKSILILLMDRIIKEIKAG